MNDDDLKDVFLCFVRLVGEENDGYYRYEFIFTDNPDEVWGENWEYKPASLVNDLMPSDEYITEIHIVKTKIKFDLIQDNSCFSLQDCIDGCVALAYYLNEEKLENSIILMFGDAIEKVEKKLAEKNILLG